MMRLFIGISPDSAARAALSETARMLSRLAPGRYVGAGQYHCTLAFLGEADASALPAIRGAMEGAAAGQAPFDLILGRVGSFGAVLWRGVLPCPALGEAAARLRKELDAARVWYDGKPFRAHFTLARNAAPPPQALGLRYPEARFAVRGLTLFESVRAPGGLRYEPRAKAEFS